MAESAHQLGRTGEELAADHFVRRGFRILDRNYRTRFGELDVVAFDGHTLVFCEVKSRTANRMGIGPFEAVHPAKRAQVRRMARSWLAAGGPGHPGPVPRPFAAAIRFDAVGVVFDRAGHLVALEHLEDAF